MQLRAHGIKLHMIQEIRNAAWTGCAAGAMGEGGGEELGVRRLVRGKAGRRKKVKKLLKLPTKDKGQNKDILRFEKKT